MRKKTIDQTDIQILNILCNAPSTPNNEIARRIKLCPSATLERIRNLRRTKILKHQFYLLNYRLLGYIHEVIIRLEIPIDAQDELSFALQHRNLIAIYFYSAPNTQSLQVDAIGTFRTEQSIEKLCDKLVSHPLGFKVTGVYKIHKLEKLSPIQLYRSDTML